MTSQFPGQGAPQYPRYGGPNAYPQQAAPRKKGIPSFVWVGLAVVLAAVLAGVGIAASGWRPGNSPDIAAMSYISANDAGPAPFTESVATVKEDEIVQVSRTSMSGDVRGGVEQLYGGSGNMAVCDVEGLISNLHAMPNQRAAFAGALGLSPGQVDQYVRSLQPVVLMHDTWVTNHGYRDGRAVPFQSVLQAGTAVLIDAYGVPRVQCGCGNPLAPRWTGYVVPTSGTPWPGYNPTYVINIYAPEYHNTTINVTNIYEEGDEYNVTFEEVVEPDRPDLATTPADMGVRPDEDMLNEAGVDPAPEEEWSGGGSSAVGEDEDGAAGATSGEVDDEGTSAERNARRSSGDDGADSDEVGEDVVDDALVSLPRTSSSTFDKDESTFEEGAVRLTVRGLDEDDKTTSGKCDITVEIKDSRGRVVDEDEDANVSCRQEFTFPDLEEGSYTAHVTVEPRDGEGEATDSVSFKVVEDLDETSTSSTRSRTSSSTSSRTSSSTSSRTTGSETSTADRVTPTSEPSAPRTSETYEAPAGTGANEPADDSGTAGASTYGDSGDSEDYPG